MHSVFFPLSDAAANARANATLPIEDVQELGMRGEDDDDGRDIERDEAKCLASKTQEWDFLVILVIHLSSMANQENETKFASNTRNSL
jgi:hypothetical protein